MRLRQFRQVTRTKGQEPLIEFIYFDSPEDSPEAEALLWELYEFGDQIDDLYSDLDLARQKARTATDLSPQDTDQA